MHKILAAVAAVALAALGTSIIATVVLHSSVVRQSKQISALVNAEHSDHQKIVALQTEVGGARKHKKLTAARLRCTPLPQPIGQPVLLLAAPRLHLLIRHAC